MASKLKRQMKIKEMLSTKFISSHEVLLKLLRAESFMVTQATLSRDFADMGVIRISTELGPRYLINPDEAGRQIARLVGSEIISIQHNESLIVIRTLAGRAQGVAHYVDRLNKPEIIGTVGGDDTLLVIPDNPRNLDKVIDLIKQIMADK